MVLWRVTERVALSLGIAAGIFYTAAQLFAAITPRVELQRFDRLVAAQAEPGEAGAESILPDPDSVDFELWSKDRVRLYRETLAAGSAHASAVLRIPALDLEVPVFDGTDDWTLNRGLGWIAGTARPGELGNVGVAGHRDGFFRGLKDIAMGDEIHLRTLTDQTTYRVDEILIVDPKDVHVLGPREQPSITLVTCYPFYFIGKAPNRYIVRASRADSGLASVRTPE